MNEKYLTGRQKEERAEAAINLMERASGAIMKAARELHHCPYIDNDQRFKRAMEYLESVREIVDEHGPDEEWFGDYFELAGMHMHLTEEGWVPASENVGPDAAEVLSEVGKSPYGDTGPDLQASGTAHETD